LTGVALLHPVPSLTLYTESSLQGWGAFLEGSVVSCSATRTLQFARDESCPISVTTFQDSSSFESSSASDGQYNSSGLLAEEILLLCLLSHIHLVVRHIPGTFNVLADCLSRFHNPFNTEWELRQVVFDSVILRWNRPHVDLFAILEDWNLYTELEKELGEAKLHLSKHFRCESTNLGEVVRQEE
jgi:hypothetical protein